MGGRGGSSGMGNSTPSGIQRAYSVDSSRYSGYARILARESNSMMKDDTEDRWLMYKNTTPNGESFIRYSLEDNYIAALGSTSQGSGATNLLTSALRDIQRYGDDSAPVEWMVSAQESRRYYDHIGLSKYRKRDTYTIPRSDIPKVIKNWKGGAVDNGW